MVTTPSFSWQPSLSPDAFKGANTSSHRVPRPPGWRRPSRVWHPLRWTSCCSAGVIQHFVDQKRMSRRGACIAAWCLSFNDATTPWPLRRRWRSNRGLSPLRQHLGQRGHNAATGCGKWVTRCERAAVDIELCSYHLAQWLGQTQLVFAEHLVLPGGQSAQHWAAKPRGFRSSQVLQRQACALHMRGTA